jgi:hypothetical protein
MIGPTDLLHSSPAPHFKTFQVFLICCSERPNFQHHTELCSRRSTSLVSSSNLSPTPAQIRDKAESNFAPDCRGSWHSSEIQTRIITAHIIGSTSHSKDLFQMPNSRSATGTQEIPRLLWSLNFITVYKTAWKRSCYTLQKLISFAFILILSAYL